MQSVRVYPSKLSGCISIPPSKSHTMRALIFASMAQSPSKLLNLLPSPDTDCMTEALKLLGVGFDSGFVIPGPLKVPKDPIYAGNSGQVYRFIRALAPVDMVGDFSIQTRRPIQPLLDGLKQIEKGCARIDGRDSQPVSAMLMHMAFRSGKSELFVDNPGETPWVAMTLSWFDKLGIAYTNDAFSHFTVTGPAMYSGFTYTVPADFSSAAFPWAINLITGSSLRLANLEMDLTQGDHRLLELDPLSGGTIDVNAFIDSVPILATLGCYAQKPLTLTNAAISRQKESDRIHAMTVELSKMGAQIEESRDGMTIYPSPLHGAEVFSHDDHRVAMALIVAALGASNPSIVHGAQCIDKSFPHFIQKVNQCSCSLALQVLEKAPLARL